MKGKRSAGERCKPPRAKDLLAWYDRHRRDLPWRARAGEHADPYRVWLSEVMLQQTTVATVRSYFARFIERWPSLRDLAEAPLDAVLAAWAGLGYYARARNLHACAQALVREHGGRFPSREVELLELPGIGAYSAAAIAAIAFGQRATILDGNVERVIARLHRVETPLPKAKTELRRLAETLTPARRPGDYAQAIMDLGAMICLPKKPLCILCPWRDSCAAFAVGDAATFPRRAPKKERPRRYGVAFVLSDGRGRVLLRRRPEKGLLGGMLETPSTDWRDVPWTQKEAKSFAPLCVEWRWLEGRVEHIFTHFALELAIAVGRLDGGSDGLSADHIWAPISNLDSLALPSLMRKVLKAANTTQH